MKRFAWVGAIVCLLPTRLALAQRLGDPTPHTSAPLVAIVSPMTGAVVARSVRVQARVEHPSGLEAVSAVRLTITGATSAELSLSPGAPYGLLPNTGLFEAVVTLAPGASTLVATATDDAERSTSSASVAVVANDGLGDGNLLVRDNASPLCSACHALADHGSESAGRAYGAWTTTCRDCHQPHGTRNVFLVRESITPPWVTGTEPPQPKAVRLATRVGFSPEGGVGDRARASFANGDGSGPCQACHTRTARWRGAGGADEIHRGDCAFCHRHARGFASRCADCHPAPPATGAHAAHRGASAPAPPFPSDPRPLGCGSCHPTDPALHGDGARQVVLNAALVLPGGTRTSGAELAGAALQTSCLVACHFPLGAPVPAAPVRWDAAGGPLPCTSCHTKINPSGVPPTARAGPSLHDPIFSEARPASGEPTTCYSCHDPARHDAEHLTGDAALLARAAVETVCIACHTPPSGPAAGAQGQVLHRGADAAGSTTPPPFPGWSTVPVDSTTGDFHGGRRGTCFGPSGPAPCAPDVTPTGYGGTLREPYSRGEPAIPCVTCHAGHASENAFLLAPVVNGVAIPPRSIDRAGVGAEKLCEACHAGGRHDRCRECHGAVVCENGQCWMDPSIYSIDPAPAGSACFWCHGHEGIRRWTEPYTGAADHGSGPDSACTHCHGFGMPATSYALGLGSAPLVSKVVATGATVTWSTTAPASSHVEYGVEFPGYVAGTASETAGGQHTVTLTGLAPATTYVWRVRSVDQFRNAVRSPLGTFTTLAVDAVPYPDLGPVMGAWTTTPDTTSTPTLHWYSVSSPSGNPVEYRVELASDPGFTTLENGSPRDSGWIAGAAGADYAGNPTLTSQVALTNLPQDDCSLPEAPSATYYWRVKARDTVTGAESAWSAAGTFTAGAGDPYGC